MGPQFLLISLLYWWKQDSKYNHTEIQKLFIINSEGSCLTYTSCYVSQFWTELIAMIFDKWWDYFPNHELWVRMEQLNSKQFYSSYEQGHKWIYSIKSIARYNVYHATTLIRPWQSDMIINTALLFSRSGSCLDSLTALVKKLGHIKISQH